MFCLTHHSRHLVSEWEPWSLSAPSRSLPGQSLCIKGSNLGIFHWSVKIILSVIFLPYRNITDVLSCFSDSPPPSPTFPEGGNPVLYGEEDNKVTRPEFWSSGPVIVLSDLCVTEYVYLFLHPECPGRTYSYPERSYKDRQWHRWRRPGSQLPRIHSVKGESSLTRTF